jgi:O-antigen/teichoic acid export membrane protein
MEAGPGPSDSRKVAVGVGLNVLGTAGRSLLAVFYVLAGRAYGAEPFGLYALAYAPVDLLAQLVSAGASDAVLRFAARDAGDTDDAVAFTVVVRALRGAFVLGLVMAGALALAAVPLTERLWHRPGAAVLVAVLAINLPLLAVLGVVLAACRAVLDMKGDLLVRGFVAPITLTGSAGLCLLVPALRSVWGLVLALTASNFMACIGAILYARRHYPIRKLWAARRRPAPGKLLGFATVQSLMQVMWNGLWSVDLLVLGPLVSNVALGYYRLASELARTIIGVRYAFSDVYAPLVARDARVGNTASLREGLTRVSRWVVLAAAPVTALTLLVQLPVMTAVSGDYPALVDGSLAILCLGPLINAATGLGGNVLVMTGHSGWAIAAVGAAFAVNWGVDSVLAPHHGLIGAATGTLVAFVVLSVVQQLGLWHRLRVRLHWRGLWAPLVARGLAFAAAHPIVMHGRPPGVPRAALAAGVFIAIGGGLILLLCPPERHWLAARLGRLRARLVRS